MQRFSLTSIGAVVTATLASLCCIGPLVLAGLGIAGLGSAGLAVTIFEPYRPYLMGFTALFLGVAFFMTYRKQEESCEEGKACAVPGALKMRKVGLWSVTGLTALMLAVPYIPVSGTSISSTTAVTETASFTVEGMDCAACATGIAASLTEHEGIAEATVDYENGSATVSYVAGSITTDRIAELITEQGFAATQTGKPTSRSSAAESDSLATTILKVEGMT